MYTIGATNVNDALTSGLLLLSQYGKRQSSRAGDVIVAPRPVTTWYRRPWEKVLFNPIRDANPFFHLLESLWLLTGQNNAHFLNTYVSDFGARFAEPETGVIHGAYGHRWREAFGLDQIAAIIAKLRANPDDRQAVLTMWDPTVEVGADDLEGPWRDRPCNTHIYFRVHENVLDMTVCCRSNDILWGAYGANAVHFGFLLDFMAAGIGVVPGTYYQVSNNYHVYVDPLEKLAKKAGEEKLDVGNLVEILHDEYPATCKGFIAFAPDQFTRELGRGAFWLIEEAYRAIQDVQSDNLKDGSFHRSYHKEDFAQTMWGSSFLMAALAHRWYRLGDMEAAIAACAYIPWDDWREACRRWLVRRMK